MSGFFGIFNRDRAAVQTADLQGAQEVYSNWFDDAHRIWREGNVGLGHVMLWNTPESMLENLPLVDGTGGSRLVITADVRLDNRAELMERLRIGDAAETVSDSYLLLEAYREWREASPRYLLGDFAYVIWDEHHGRLFCARDHLGIKQLYYCLTPRHFIFANDVSALLAFADVPSDLNDEAIAMYLKSSRYVHPQNTFYKGVSKLQAASTLQIAEDKVIHDSYWRAQDSPDITLDTFEDYRKRLRELLEDAVRVRLRSAYPITSHLSGGLDSSAITVLASRMLGRAGKVPQVFNWSYNPDSEAAPESVEWSYAKRVAAQENIPIEPLIISPRFIKDHYLSADISHYEDNLYWEETCLRARSSASGARSILSGWGGDELISYGGYSYYSALLRRGRFLHVFKLLYQSGRQKNRSLYRISKRFAWFLLYSIFPKKMDGLYKVEEDQDIFNVVAEPFASRLNDALPPSLEFRTDPHGEQKELFNHGYLGVRIENWAASALRDGTEYRYPLLDKRIVEFALGIPEALIEPARGYSRYLFRSAVADILPEEVAWAPKYDSPKHFESRKRLWLECLKLLEERDIDTGGDDEFVDTASLRQIIATIVARNSTDFEDTENIGVVAPALAVAVLQHLRNLKYNK